MPVICIYDQLVCVFHFVVESNHGSWVLSHICSWLLINLWPPCLSIRHKITVGTHGPSSVMVHLPWIHWGTNQNSVHRSHVRCASPQSRTKHFPSAHQFELLTGYPILSSLCLLLPYTLIPISLLSCFIPSFLFSLPHHFLHIVFPFIYALNSLHIFHFSSTHTYFPLI